MRPSAIYEALATDTKLQQYGVTEDRIVESQSVDSRPFADGHFITISGDEVLFSGTTAIAKGPRTFTIAVHINSEMSRDYGTIDFILAQASKSLTGIEDVIGADGCRVSQVAKTGRSGNLLDEGWNTITRNATFGVLYDELPS